MLLLELLASPRFLGLSPLGLLTKHGPSLFGLALDLAFYLGSLLLDFLGLTFSYLPSLLFGGLLLLELLECLVLGGLLRRLALYFGGLLRRLALYFGSLLLRLSGLLRCRALYLSGLLRCLALYLGSLLLRLSGLLLRLSGLALRLSGLLLRLSGLALRRALYPGRLSLGGLLIVVWDFDLYGP